MSEIEIDITPDVRLLHDIGAANYTVPQAINELVANCIDARFNDESLQIDVEIDESHISVADNGCGMTSSVLGAAMRLSADMDKVTGNSKPRKGKYGLGMKAACASLGERWSVTTRPPGSSEVYSTSVDLRKWVSKEDRASWKMTIKTTDAGSDGFFDSRPHGTVVRVTKLAARGYTFIGAVIDSLASAYKPHLEAGDQIRVNGVEVLPKAYDLVDGRKWEIDLAVDDYRIRGWVGLDKKTHNKGDYGLNIYRQNQLVEAHNKDFFRNHLMTSRIVGEVHLDFVNATFHKLGFHRNSPEWKKVEPILREFLKPVVKASETMSKNKNDVLRKQKAIQELDRVLGLTQGQDIPVETQLQGSAEKAGEAEAGSEKMPSSRPQADGGVYGSLEAIGIGPEDFSLTYTLAEMDDEEIPWDYIYDAKSRELQAVINMNSRVYDKIGDKPLLAALALSEAVIGFLINERQIAFNDAKDIRDQWLAKALS